MMAVVEGIPREALEGGGPWDWRTFAEYLDRVDTGLAVNAGFLVGHSTVRRVVMGEAATRAEADARAAGGHGRAWWRSRWPAGRSGFSSSLGEGHLDGDHRPVPSSCGRPSTSSWPWPARCATTRAPRSSSSRPIGPIPDERVELMADMSLAADRPLNWNLLGQPGLARRSGSSSCAASDVAAARGAHVVALALPDMMRMRARTPCCPACRAGGTSWPSTPPAAGPRPPIPATRAGLRAGAEKVAEPGHRRAGRLLPHGGGRPRLAVGGTVARGRSPRRGAPT